MNVGQLIAVLSHAPLEDPVLLLGNEGEAFAVAMVALINDAKQEGGGFGYGVMLVPKNQVVDLDMVLEGSDAALWIQR